MHTLSFRLSELQRNVLWYGFNLLVGIAAFGMAMYAFSMLVTAQIDTYTVVAELFGIGGAVLFCVYTAMVGFSILEAPRPIESLGTFLGWISDQTNGLIARGTAWFLVVSTPLVLAFGVLVQLPVSVEVPMEQLAVLANGVVVSEGASAPMDRWNLYALVSMQQDVSAYISVPLPDGAVVNIEIQGNVVLEDTKPLHALLTRRRSDVISDYKTTDEVRQKEFFSQYVAWALVPMAKGLVDDVAQRKISGTQAAMLLDLARRVSAHRSALPLWIGHVEISSVNIPDWSLATSN